MSISLPKPISVPPTAPDDRDLSFPPLETGQCLASDEFMRRYEAAPDLKNIELIEGVVYVASPVRLGNHAKPHLCVIAWIGNYMARTPGTDGGADCTTILDDKNVPQPDCVLFLLPEHGGQTHVSEKDYLVGAPELAVEISASTASADRNKKLTAYERNGIREYIICRVLDAQVDWLFLKDGKYQRLAPSADGILRSITFPGLWLDPATLFRGDLAALFKTLNQGLESPEHAEFVERIHSS
jgi:Uma2 family endonuclease